MMTINTRSKTFNRLAGRGLAGWLKFAGALGRVNSWLLLSVVFYVFLTPLALLYRLFNGKRGEFFANKDHGSTWRDDVPEHTPSSFGKTW